jgi:hypothetical protein
MVLGTAHVAGERYTRGEREVGTLQAHLQVSMLAIAASAGVSWQTLQPLMTYTVGPLHMINT